MHIILYSYHVNIAMVLMKITGQRCLQNDMFIGEITYYQSMLNVNMQVEGYYIMFYNSMYSGSRKMFVTLRSNLLALR